MVAIDVFTKCLALTFIGMTAPESVRADIYERIEKDGEIRFSNHPTAEGFRAFAVEPIRSAPDASGQDSSAGTKLIALANPYRTIVRHAARNCELDPARVHAVIAVESGFDPRAVSRKGASGLMQLMPDTAKRYGANDTLDPIQNIDAGAKYLRYLLKTFNNNLPLALAAFNAGEGAVARYGTIPPFRETATYVPKVLALYKKFSAIKDI
jgi:soluble lytic murein transglycosylase-like protein